MPTFLDLCKMFLMTYGFISSMKLFCYGVVWLVKYRQDRKFKKEMKGFADYLARSRPKVKDPVTEFYEILEHKN
jgi:hypothetical protein